MPLSCFLEQTTFPLLSTGSAQEDASRHDLKKLVWDVKNQTKQTKEKLLKLREITLTVVGALSVHFPFVSGTKGSRTR